MCLNIQTDRYDRSVRSHEHERSMLINCPLERVFVSMHFSSPSPSSSSHQQPSLDVDRRRRVSPPSFRSPVIVFQCFWTCQQRYFFIDTPRLAWSSSSFLGMFFFSFLRHRDEKSGNRWRNSLQSFEENELENVADEERREEERRKRKRKKSSSRDDDGSLC